MGKHKKRKPKAHVRTTLDRESAEPADSPQTDPSGSTDDAAETASRTEPPAPFGADHRPDNLPPGDRRSLRHPLWIHPGVPDAVRERPALFRRLGLLIEQLGAMGRTSVIKGCKPPNTGWYRAPLGGNRGSQYYLWWSPASTDVVRELPVKENGIVLQAVRHHDDHRPLLHSKPGDYIEIAQPDHIDDHIAGRPWTQAQDDFERSTAPVRVLEGTPGSGKTTALWHAIDARPGERILYITWSGALTDEARRHFDSFAPASTTVDCVDFNSLASRLASRDIPRITNRESISKFNAVAAELHRRIQSPWMFIQDSLHAEFRGVLFGYAHTGHPDIREQGGCLRLTDTAYRKARKVSRRSLNFVTRLAATLTSKQLNDVFPELVGARDALETLGNGNGGVPGELLEYDRLVVDEAQDLTMTEISVVIELCRRIGAARGRTPFLLIAGDEGQNVRATSFHWSRVRNLISDRLTRPHVFTLERQLRSPQNIADTIDDAASLYSDLNKASRPQHQHRERGDPNTPGCTIHVLLDDQKEACDLVRRIDETGNATVISSTHDCPEWLDDDARDRVLTPAEAKGLEFQAACILDPSTAIGRASPLSGDTLTFATEQHETRRNAINELRVAMSRATETLALIETRVRSKRSPLTDVLPGRTGEYSGDELIEHLEDGERTPIERITAITAELPRLREENPDRALYRACQVIPLMLDNLEVPFDPSVDVSNEDRRVVLDTTRDLLETASWLILNDVADTKTAFHLCATSFALRYKPEVVTDGTTPDTYSKKAFDDELAEVMKAAEKGIDPKTALASKVAELTDVKIVSELSDWNHRDLGTVVRTVTMAAETNELHEPHGHWVTAALRSRQQSILAAIRDAANEPGCAAYYHKHAVEKWLTMMLGGRREDHGQEAAALNKNALETLLTHAATQTGNDRAEAVKKARSILKTGGPNPLADARIHELEGRVTEAVNGYRKAGARDHLQRVIREHALWEQAAGAGDPALRDDADLLLAIENAVHAVPASAAKRLTKSDLARLRQAVTDLESRAS